MANGIANDIVNAINNSIASIKYNSPVHVKVNDLAKAIDKDTVNRIVKVYPCRGGKRIVSW
jgi:hypothetical protein